MLAAAPDDTFVLFANSRKPMRLPEFSAPNVELRTFAYPNKAFNLALKVARTPALDRLVGGLDVLFVPSMRLAPVSGACPLVLTIHDLSYVRHPEYFSPHRRFWHWFMEPAALARSAAHIITVSATTRSDVQRLYRIPDDRVSFVHSGIGAGMRPLDRASAAVRRVRDRYGLPSRFILFLGTLEPRKNLRGLLEAYTAARARGVAHHLVLAGERGWIDETFFADLQKNPYAGDIHLTGFVNDDDKPALYSAADLFVYPSFYEGFGFPPLEALACGTPVITSYNSAIPEVAGEWVTLVNPFDAEELATAMEERLRAPQRESSELTHRLHEHYAWDRAGQKTLEILRRVGQQVRVSTEAA